MKAISHTSGDTEATGTCRNKLPSGTQGTHEVSSGKGVRTIPKQVSIIVRTTTTSTWNDFFSSLAEQKHLPQEMPLSSPLCRSRTCDEKLLRCMNVQYKTTRKTLTFTEIPSNLGHPRFINNRLEVLQRTSKQMQLWQRRAPTCFQSRNPHQLKCLPGATRSSTLWILRLSSGLKCHTSTDNTKPDPNYLETKVAPFLPV